MTRAILIVLDSVGCGGAEDADGLRRRGRRHARPYRRSLRRRARAIATACGAGRSRLPHLDGARPRPRDAGLDRPRAAGLRARRAARPMGLSASRPRAARTRRPAIGRSPARRSISTGAISPRRSPPFPEALTDGADRRGQASRHSRQPPRLGHDDHRGIRRGAPADAASRSATPRPTRSSRSPRTRRPSGSSGSTSSAASRAGSAIRSNIGRVIARPFVGAKREGFRPHRQPQGFRGAAARRQSAAAGGARGPRDRLDRQDRRHLRPSRHRRGAQGQEQRRQRRPSPRGARRRPPTAGSSSSIWSISTPNAAIAATSPAIAACLEAFDRRLAEIEAAMRPHDYCLITADHGNDPTFQRLRPHPRARADPRLRRRRAGRADRRAREPRRHRRDDRRQARPAEGAARDGLAGMSFALDERLARDTFVVGDMPLCARAADERRALALAHPRPAARGRSSNSSISTRPTARY